MAIVRKYKTKVVGCRRILPDVYTVSLATQDRLFAYKPGQFLHLTLDPFDPAQPWPDSRCFSIQTPPSSGGTALDITFATKGAFTQRMAAELAPEREIWVKLPYGDLFNNDPAGSPCVFIAGGTGVTPFLSLFLDADFKRFAEVSLFLGIRNPDYHVFAAELEQAQAANPAFRVEIVREDTQGYIPIDRIAATHGTASIYFISGPPVMIRAFRTALLAAGVPGENIRTDDWE